MFFPGYGLPPTSFEQTYRCYPASFIDRPSLESGDKIIMPPSALDRLASLHIDYPMLFELYNSDKERKSHCGVLEFVAEEGMIYMPYWMMQNMLLEEGDKIRVKNATLPKGTYVRLQPHTQDFLDISNPKAVLETTLRNYSCLTTGDTILVPYNNKKYYIDIVETKPEQAISIIETDCEVDFATPLDYKEPQKPTALNAPGPSTDQTNITDEPKFSPFSGVGRRLDGKPLKHSPAPLTSTGSSAQTSNTTTVGSQTGSIPTRSRSGKVVFGTNSKVPNVSSKVDSQEKQDSSKKEPPKFQAFSGKSYSLKD
eukprot:TRINITY_DN2290_c0_g2_i3.p1 TRINITY_DN2290_c0_g2~~TRINITY_DN2290_c0_g2_i3.p1  ORF type:complete len:311 (-),score=59.12 TRINITY_DN2290_c0_g2_i3:151-1083(-)